VNLCRSENCIFRIYGPYRLSADALLVYQKTVHEDKKQVIPGASSQKMRKLILCDFEPDVLSNFKALVADT
jgi:hypothetical protein